LALAASTIGAELAARGLATTNAGNASSFRALPRPRLGRKGLGTRRCVARGFSRPATTHPSALMKTR